jgi:chitinase
MTIKPMAQQMPANVLVGYWQAWSPLKLSEIHPAYNVIQLAFATTVSGSEHQMEFVLPWTYSSKQAFLDEIESLQNQNKKVILSIGGAADPVIIDTPTKVTEFVNSINAIMAEYNYIFDGIDLDLESTSLNFGAWTMSAPAQGQLNLINATEAILDHYQAQTGRRMLLTMAPENVYLQGGLSAWQLSNINGGAWLPVLEGLKDRLDLIHPQYYNAGGAGGGTFTNTGLLFYDTGDPDYLTAITETLIEGFTLLDGRGVFTGIEASKVAIGLPSNACNAAGTGFVTPENVALALKYLRGEISKPVSFDYTLNSTYPELRGLMTWSINEDLLDCPAGGSVWSFAQNFADQIPVGLNPRQLYANPNEDQLVNVHNIRGEKILTLRMDSMADLQLQVEVRVKTPGIYFIKGQQLDHHLVIH